MGKKSTINTRFWLSLLQNESEINYVGKSFKAHNLALIGKHILHYMFILAQNDARNAVRSRSALHDCMTEQS